MKTHVFMLCCWARSAALLSEGFFHVHRAAVELNGFQPMIRRKLTACAANKRNFALCVLFFRKGDWSFLVGHALGVDHVGHMAVLDSELMHDKLLQVNRLMKETLKGTFNRNVKGRFSRPLQSIFLVFGDHGMTEAGAHGGGSSEEVGNNKV